MKNLKNILSAVAILLTFTFITAQTSTYTIGSTEYISGEYYSTTGNPKVVRSASNKKAFLNANGYNDTPYGYEIDHIVPLSQGGSDDPSNMQLLTISQHKAKTARERKNVSMNTIYSKPSFTNPVNDFYSTPSFDLKKTNYKSPSFSSPTYSSPSYSTPSRTIQTGPRGGKYYINSNGNKTYVKN